MPLLLVLYYENQLVGPRQPLSRVRVWDSIPFRVAPAPAVKSQKHPSSLSFSQNPKALQESNSSNNTIASSKSSSKFQTDLSNLPHGNLPIADQGSQTRCSWRSARSSRRAPLVYLGTSHPSRRRTPLLR